MPESFRFVAPMLCLLFLCACTKPQKRPETMENLPSAAYKAIDMRLPRMIELVRIPASPFRVRVNLGPVANAVGKPSEPLDVFLFRDGRLAIELGRADSDHKLPPELKATLRPEDQGIYKVDSASGFELRVYNAQRELVARQRVVVLITSSDRVTQEMQRIKSIL